MTFAFPVVVHQLTSGFFSILFRIPFPHRSSHPGSPKDQTQAGGRGQETDISLREENSIKERQSTVSVSLSLPPICYQFTWLQWCYSIAVAERRL